MEQKKHFVLVHGACHGAWCWYKVKPILESVGHKVTVLDLAAAGINTKTIEEVRTLEDYSSPLLEAVATIPQGEKVILVGHSLGGYSLAVAMEKFPTTISLAIFVTAVLPDTINNPFYVLDQCFEKIGEGEWLDTKFDYSGTSQQPHPALLLGQKFVEEKLYHLSPIEDITLATTLLRPVSLFQENRTAANTYFSEERYGSVQRAYIVCDQDQVAPKEFQHWMIANAGVKEVKEIKGVDHMPMFSKPRELCAAILELA